VQALVVILMLFCQWTISAQFELVSCMLLTVYEQVFFNCLLFAE